MPIDQYADNLHKHQCLGLGAVVLRPRDASRFDCSSLLQRPGNDDRGRARLDGYLLRGAVARVAEQEPFKLMGAGSSPAGPIDCAVAARWPEG